MAPATKTAIPKSLFRRIVKAEINQASLTETMITSDALAMIQGASEEHMQRLFANAALVAGVAGRDTLYAQDMETVMKINSTRPQ